MPTPISSAALDALARSQSIAVCTLSGCEIVGASPGVDRLLGEGAGQSGTDLSSFAVPADRAAFSGRLRAFSTSTETSLRIQFQALDPGRGMRDLELVGMPVDGLEGRQTMAWLTDRTDEVRAETQLSFLAYHDALTGLPNRAYFTDQIRKALSSARKSTRPFALLLIDLDGFKAVNDKHGHDVGDALLQIIGQRLSGCSRLSDTVARLGGDEFALLMTHMRQPEDGAVIAGRIVRAVQPPIQVGGVECQVGASVGISVYPTHAGDSDALFTAADNAMYDAKQSGRGRYRWAVERDSQPPSAALQFVSWSDDHRVDVPSLDAQHEHIAERINRLGAGMKAGLEIEPLLASLRSLVCATEEHFAFEEALMLEHNVEHVQEHVSIHRRLLDDLKSLTVGLDERSIVLTMRYLQQWLFLHVDTVDRVMARELTASGVH